MGFAAFNNTYDWSKLATYRQTAMNTPNGQIDLSVGSPVDPVPQSVQRALAAAANEHNAFGYPKTIGTDELRGAIAHWMRVCRGVDMDAVGAGVVPTVGSKEAVALMASLLGLGQGDVVIQPKVSYPTYEIGTQIAEASVHKVDDVADTDSWRTIPGVKAIWINSPSNPTGAVLSADQLAGIVAAAREIGAVVLSDECYAMMDWRTASTHDDSNEAQAANSFSLSSTPCVLSPAVCEGSAKSVLMLYSLSKQSNMAGYRTAFIAGDADIIKHMSAYRKQLGLIIPGPVQAAMAAGLRDVASVHNQWKRYRYRLESLVSALRDYGYDAHMPQGGLYVWVKALSGDCWNDMAALADLGIVPSPGEFYGAPDSLRFSSTADDETIELACSALRHAA